MGSELTTSKTTGAGKANIIWRLTSWRQSTPIGKFFVGAAVVLVLALAFYQNQWRIIDPAYFNEFQRDSDGLVVGRLIKARRDGLLAAGGLLGRADVPIADTNNTDKQFDIYLNSRPFSQFYTYNSQIGFQATFFAIIDQLTNFSPAFNLALFRMISAVLAASVYAIMVVWLWREFGWLSAALVFIFLVVSRWPTLFGAHIFWGFWAIYLPLIGPAAYLVLDEGRRTTYTHTTALCVVFVSVFVKCLFNGYEYITTALVMLTVPYVYFALKRRWPVRQFIQRGAVVVAGSISAVLASMVILVFQISAVEGAPAAGVNHIVSSFFRRTYADANQFSEAYRASLQASPISVFVTYLQIPAISWRFIFDTPFRHVDYTISIGFGYLIAIILFFTLAHVAYRWLSKTPPADQWPIATLIWTTWFSTLAPLSWIVTFNAHAYIHTFIDPIVWYMPYLLLGWTLCGLVAVEIGRPILMRFAPRLLPTPAQIN